MEVVSACPLPVGSLVWQTWSGAFALSVVCKATFLLRSVESRLADEQDPIVDADRYWNDDPREWLCEASDLVPFKRRADVILVGHAYAPFGVKVSSLLTRLCVAGADKLIEVFTDRVFTYQGQLREVSPAFTKSPLVWRYAAGGPGTPNPIGIRADAPPDPYGQRLVPRLQPAGLQITSPDDLIRSIGYGPVAPHWPGRLAKLNHHASTWDHAHWSRRPLPRDIDAAYFSAAPPDQQVEAIRPDERIVLENLHPDIPRLVTNLAPVVPEAVVERLGQPAETVPFVCDTMWIDTDRSVCSVSWRARILLDAPNAPGRVVVRLATGSGDAGLAGRDAQPSRAAASERPAAPSDASGPAVAAVAPTAAVASSGAPAGAAAPAATAAPAPSAPRSIERCAEIAASCALRANDTLAILTENGLTEEEWDALEDRWAQVLRKDAAEHETARLAAYDQAYVARLEKERGPITPEAYARLTLAHERDKGALTRALRDLGLPWGATARIQRVFAERMAANPALAASVRAAMTER